MTGITKDDLLVVRWCDREDGHHADHADHYEPPTDEEFDRLAREAGYVKPFHRVEVPLDLSTMDATDRAKALRALLTDECEACEDRRRSEF